MNEKREFSERLRAAMKAQNLEASGPVLECQFGLHWLGKPVRRQTVWKRLNGEAIATQDKLQELARRLKLDPQQLRFGDHVQTHLRAEQKRWEEGVGHLERETFDAFLQLPAPQRKLIREVILTFAKVHAGESNPERDPVK